MPPDPLIMGLATLPEHHGSTPVANALPFLIATDFVNVNFFVTHFNYLLSHLYRTSTVEP